MTDKHRVLAIDGDGARIFLSLRILHRLELTLRKREHDPTLTLGQWFDYVGGTNTGGVAAALIALGHPIAEIEKRLHAAAPSMLHRRGFVRWIRANGLFALFGGAQRDQTMRPDTFEQSLRSWFSEDGKPLTLGDVHGKANCHLLLGLHNLTTDSPWPLSTNEKAQFNSDPAGNLNLELWSLVRATVASPQRFDPVRLPIVARSRTGFDFVDAAVGGLTNLTLQLVLMATLGSYRLGWQADADHLLVVSIGSGITERLPDNPKQGRRPTPAHYSRRQRSTAMLQHTARREDLLCRVMSSVRWAAPEIDIELAGAHQETVLGGGSLFSYVRYDDLLTDEALRRLNVGHAFGDDVRHRNRLPVMSEMHDVGESIADQVLEEHLVGF